MKEVNKILKSMDGHLLVINRELGEVGKGLNQIKWGIFLILGLSIIMLIKAFI